jgi:hypothetical protein
LNRLPLLESLLPQRTMFTSFTMISGTNIGVRRERVPSATAALRLVREHMKLRRPGVRIEDRHGNSVTFFQLMELAEAESRGKYMVMRVSV